ncbi:Patatin-like phospholipase [Marinomonas gallaica]|uniref:Patatin-like phospholipase n=1 Tax=Marinomonas gallaica TaxID=1806667 RepID=A0A1C3JV28_9GAMM|nr:patatin-like phospholipase family protein [Marinomonas gallaica]SBT18997.1 Patatin-like phospholipase [Marinomonas gallaica]SBT21952.1 Patatin-like phospholipase [Marinomonas gallaica]
MSSKAALLLSGGGARGAYQIGVLQGLAKLVPQYNALPFPILCGTSAGALNAALLATRASNFKRGVRQLAYIWRNLTTEQVYQVSRWPIATSITRSIANIFLNQRNGRQLSLMVNTPLESLLRKHLNLEDVSIALNQRLLETLAITAINYTNGNSTTFFQSSNTDIEDWQSARKTGVKQAISIEHLLASSAIPGIFPSQKVGNHYYGDGAVRLGSIIQPAIRLGAEKLFIIGVSDNRQARDWNYVKDNQNSVQPSIVQVLGQLFNSAFLDTVDDDITHIETLNRLLSLVPEDKRPADLPLRKTLVISPSKGLNVLANEHLDSLPRHIQKLLRTASGNQSDNASSAASYLLFTPEYCSALIDLGYKDAMWQQDKILDFFSD